MREQTFAVTLAVHPTMPAHSCELAEALAGVARVTRIVQVCDPADAEANIRHLLERAGVPERVIVPVLTWVQGCPDDEPDDAARWTPSSTGD